jgi:biotin operon repressor
MIYYPMILPVTLMAIGTVLLILPLTILRNYGINNTGTAKVNAGGDAIAETPGISDILKLLPSQEREVLEYVIKAGGEVFQYQIMRDLGLSKVRAWRIVRRLEEKGLVEVSKVKGRNVVNKKEE